MSEFIEDNKKKIVVIAIIVLGTIIIGIVNMVMNGSSTKQSPKTSLEELGKAYYEEIYYPKLKNEYPNNYKTILGNYSKTGKKVTLLQLLTTIENANDEAFYNNKKNTSCDLTLTYINIYPMESFDSDDYKIETFLHCDIKGEVLDATNEDGE